MIAHAHLTTVSSSFDTDCYCSKWHLTPLHTTRVSLLQSAIVLYELILSEAGTPTGSPSGPPPPVDSSITETVQKSAESDLTGQSSSGKDKHGNEAGQTVMGEAGKEMLAEEAHSDHHISNH